MTARIEARVDDEGRVVTDAYGPTPELMDLLAEAAEDVADRTGARPQAILERAKSRVASRRRRAAVGRSD